MDRKIKIGIIGYGNLGKGVELALRTAPDMELCGVFTRRDPKELKVLTEGVRVFSVNDFENLKNGFDAVILCGGSATDLPLQGPKYAALCNTVDSFDTHARIPEYFKAVDDSAKRAGKVSLISVGWDPGLFSLLRLYGNSVLPDGADYTFWGRGVSQGHSDAIRRIKGVKNAKQYTVPVDDAVRRVRNGEYPVLSTGEKHTRECYVVPEEGADLERIKNEIVTMPNYFSDYKTTVHFISEEQFDREHQGMSHGGHAIRCGRTGNKGQTEHVMELSLTLGSNPEFTSSVLVAYARAAYRMQKEGKTGAFTVFDVPPAYLSAKSGEELRKSLL